MERFMMISEDVARLTTLYKDIFTTVYLIRGKGGVILFDAASSDEDVDERILPALEAFGASAQELKYVFISHPHRDHAGGLNRLLERCPDICIVSRSADLRAKYESATFLMPEDGDVLAEEFRVVTIPGHTADSMALLDTRTNTMITGDCLQLYGIFGGTDWACAITLPAEHRQAVEKVRAMQVDRILTAHDYHPYGYSYEGREAVERALDACMEPLEQIKELIGKNPGWDDAAVREAFNGMDRRPTVNVRVVAAVRKAMEDGRFKTCSIKNIEVHNIGKIRDGAEPGSFRWYRVPEEIYERMETDLGKTMCRISTGVELRFVMKSDKVTIRMRTLGNPGVFHVFWGSIQGNPEGKTVVTNEFDDFVIEKTQNMPMLHRITKDFGYPFDPEVVRVIFDRGAYEIADIIGDVEPPKPEQVPAKTMLAYGSSITHGSHSIDASHSWVSVVGHNLKMDCWNLGMAGSCCMEPALVDYMAQAGEEGKWDLAVLELGINVLDDWEEELFRERVDNTVKQIAGRNPEKAVYVISPFYCDADYEGKEKIKRWREVVEESVKALDYPNVTYINGLDLLGDMSLICEDTIHPNIYGVAQIAQRLTKIIKG